MTNRVEKTDAQWRAELSPEQYHVLREKGTERAWTGALNAAKADGGYRCAGCATPVARTEWSRCRMVAGRTAVSIP